MTASTPAVPAKTDDSDTVATPSETPELLAEDLIEEVSIDGMCGVY